MRAAYYNEIDPFAVAWLRNLIAAGHIAPGDVDDRSIVEVAPSDLNGYTQCHFFAGIGVWSYALRAAGWPDDRPVHTGSCPCQPFSVAGRKKGFHDDRHLWPAWYQLIVELSPPVLFGEQVANPDGLEWFDLVHADLEGAGYAVGGADLCAAGVGAPHIRQRLYFAADAVRVDRSLRLQSRSHEAGFEVGRRGAASSGAVGNAGGTGGRRDARAILGAQAEGTSARRAARSVLDELEPASPAFWSDVEWILCSDGKARPTKPGLRPLSYGTAGRVGRLRAYGNAIVAPLAAEFVRAYLDVT